MRCIRNFDGFARPVMFTYKGEDQFTTVFGGFATIITSLLLLLYATQQVLFLFLQPDYSEMVISSYADFTTNKERLQINTEYNTLAAQVFFAFDETGKAITEDPETVARVQFFQTERTSAAESDLSFKFVPTARCKDIYADEIKTSKFFQVEFADPSWICPDVRTLEVFNNPFLFDTGKNFVMVVNDCNVAVAVDSVNNLTSYSDKTCKDDATLQTLIDDMRVSYKILG